LIAFQAFLLQKGQNISTTFKSWMDEHAEFSHMLHDAFEEVPRLAFIIPESQISKDDGDSRILRARSGSALQSNTILKEDHFPGCQSSRLGVNRIDGGPNFRRLPILYIPGRGFDFARLPQNSWNAPFSPSVLFALEPFGTHEHQIDNLSRHSENKSQDIRKRHIAGVAIPTYDAIKTILADMGAGSDRSSPLNAISEHSILATPLSIQKAIIWTSLREEPVIYINCKPYVLRSLERPYENYETTGIARARIENIEMRMKADILAEAMRYNGTILLHGEVANSDGRFVLASYKEQIDPSRVWTCADLYAHLANKGFRVRYFRLPM
jgi:hypothetical protein